MRIGNAKDLENALNRSILADTSMQGVEGDIRLQFGEHFSNVAADIDPRNAIAGALERVGATASRIERDWPFRRPAAHQHRNMFHEPSGFPPRRDAALSDN